MPTRHDRLTPMERHLVQQAHRLEKLQTDRLAAQDRRIAELEAKVDARETAIATLTDTLTHLLGPLDQDASSRS